MTCTIVAAKMLCGCYWWSRAGFDHAHFPFFSSKKKNVEYTVQFAFILCGVQKHKRMCV